VLIALPFLSLSLITASMQEQSQFRNVVNNKYTPDNRHVQFQYRAAVTPLVWGIIVAYLH
jgi:hypothetical protein